MEESVITCPNCNEFIIVEKLNCGIFRHGMVKENGKQMDPHLSKEHCDFLIDNNLIHGCGKPFQIINENGVWKIQKCEYI
jgi:hypothetical protein